LLQQTHFRSGLALRIDQKNGWIKCLLKWVKFVIALETQKKDQNLSSKIQCFALISLCIFLKSLILSSGWKH
jgi:hypothetical protein